MHYPNARKLQRVPVPVMGGVAVYAGIMAGCIVFGILMFDTVLTWGFSAMTFMMLIGVWDDVKDISARFRLLIEIFLVLGKFSHREKGPVWRFLTHIVDSRLLGGGKIA